MSEQRSVTREGLAAAMRKVGFRPVTTDKAFDASADAIFAALPAPAPGAPVLCVCGRQRASVAGLDYCTGCNAHICSCVIRSPEAASATPPAVASEGLVRAWRAYSDRFMDPANRDSPTAIRDAFAAGWDARPAVASEGLRAALERLRVILREDGWVEGSLAVGIVDDALGMLP